MKLIQNAPLKKLTGSFYTPEPIAYFILKWAMNGGTKFDILEPSCGDGVFLRQLKENRFSYGSVTAVEIDPVEAEKARNIPMPNTKVLTGEFHAYCNSTKDRFDLVVGNPPFIRYQYFDDKQQAEAEKIFSRASLNYSRLANPWVSFLVGSSLLLKKEGGKIGFVVPAEILQVSYARQIRDFLAHFYNKINIISFKKLIFPDIEQEIVLLLCEKNGSNSHLIEHLEIGNAGQLQTLDITRLKSPKKRIDFKSNKWTFYFLDQPEIDFIEKLLNERKILPIRRYARVEVGMTTGWNKFFTVPESVVKKYNLQDYMKPMVGRSVQIPSLVFTVDDWKSNIKQGARAYFLIFPRISEIRKNEKAVEYIREAERQGINKGYKCGIRDEWQIVPSAWVSHALFQRRNHMYPKLVINEAKAYTTDTMHRVTVSMDVDVKAFVASYYNSLSLASSEICGRSHGGGALELMPNEVENVLLPYRKENAEILGRLDTIMRDRKRIDEMLKFSDKIILKEGCGFTETEIKLANRIWRKLLYRRLNRGKRQRFFQ